MRNLQHLFWIIMIGCWGITGDAQAVVANAKTDKVSVDLITQYDAVNLKQKMQVILHFKISPQWHIFSQNVGDIGVPTQVMWNLPDGFTAKELSWSADKEFVNDGIIQHGYEDEVYYQALITPNKDVIKEALGEKITIQATVKWLACGDECVPEQKTIMINLPLSEFEQLPSADWNQIFIQVKEQQNSSNEDENSLLKIVFFAFIGGIIMNAMPCVFPILALKALNLAQSAENRKQSRTDTIFYVAGVLLSFIVIAAILLLLRWQGHKLGWGFQLQSPWFVGFMAILFVIIGLSLLDIITINSPIKSNIEYKNRALNSLLTGFLAVLIASPCTAPFMGVAIGYTLSSSVYVYFPIFMSLGLGYALPFAIIGWFPKQIYKIMPRSGNWMLTFKKVLAIPVFLTVLWLLWILQSQLTSTTQPSQTISWKPYNKTEVSELIAQNKPVFIDFSAKWCLTCLMNEKSTLDTAKFAELEKKYNLNLFRADWTNHSDEITQALKEYGRNSIPLYVYYNGKDKNYVILPQLITIGIVEDTFKQK